MPHAATLSTWTHHNHCCWCRPIYGLVFLFKWQASLPLVNGACSATARTRPIQPAHALCLQLHRIVCVSMLLLPSTALLPTEGGGCAAGGSGFRGEGRVLCQPGGCCSCTVPGRLPACQGELLLPAPCHPHLAAGASRAAPACRWQTCRSNGRRWPQTCAERLCRVPAPSRFRRSSTTRAPRKPSSTC